MLFEHAFTYRSMSSSDVGTVAVDQVSFAAITMLATTWESSGEWRVSHVHTFETTPRAPRPRVKNCFVPRFFSSLLERFHERVGEKGRGAARGKNGIKRGGGGGHFTATVQPLSRSSRPQFVDGTLQHRS